MRARSLAAYTAQLGNGVSAHHRRSKSRAGSSTVFGLRTALVPAELHGGHRLAARNNLGGSLAAGTASRPDIVANLRVDQAWGSAQIMGAVHDASGGYYYLASAAPPVP